MRLLYLLRSRLRSLFRRKTVDDEMERELSLHLEQLRREQMAEGLSAADAQRAARLAFGSPSATADRCRDARRVGLLEDLVRDTAYALRLLARSPGFASAAVLSLALGIGANAAIFGVVDAVLLRALPVERPEELVFLRGVGPSGLGGTPPYPWFERVRADAPAFSALSAFAADELRIEVDGSVEQVFGQIASGNHFDVLGLKPAAGRLTIAADEERNPAVAVIGYGYWQRRFGGDPGAIGKTIVLGGRTHTIVGVTPDRFWGLHPGRQIEVTLPISRENAPLADPAARWYSAIGRLRPGASREQAAAQATTIFQSFVNDGPDRERRSRGQDRIGLVPASRGLDGLRNRFSMPLYALTLVSAIVLLTACVNLGSLLLARGTARSREFAIRLATGAGAGRLVRQLLTETLVIFVLGASAGLAFAYAGARELAGFFAIGRNPILLDVRFDWRLVAFAAAVGLGAGLVTGLWPALRALRTDPHSAIKDGDGRQAGSQRFGAAGRWLVIGQVALSLVLVVAAAMFVRTMANLRTVELGFSPRQILTMSLDPLLDTKNAGGREQFWRASLDRVRRIPGVRAASLSVLTPLSGRDTGTSIAVPGYVPFSPVDGEVRLNHVSEDYFRTFGIPLRDGREFTSSDADGALRVVVLNEAAARAYFGSGSAIGATIELGSSVPHRVVGVVADHKHRSVREPAPRFAFVPLWQRLENIGRITLALASEQPVSALVHAAAREVRAVHPNTLVSDVIDVEDQLDATLVSERLLSTLATSFAVLALGLAAIGLYGVLSYTVSRRAREFGLRMALGAPRSRVASGVFRDVAVQIGIGVALGLPAALAVAHTSQNLLFGVTSADPVHYVVGIVLLALIGGLSAWLPARRACSIDPSETLRRG